VGDARIGLEGIAQVRQLGRASSTQPAAVRASQSANGAR
jgi:hypothetical protein